MARYNNFNVNKKIEFLQSGDHGYNPTERKSFYLWNDPETVDDLAPGRYRHFKGGEYELLYTAFESEGYADLQVVYRSVSDGKIWVRPAHMWNDLVFNGERFVKRFESI